MKKNKTFFISPYFSRFNFSVIPTWKESGKRERGGGGVYKEKELNTTYTCAFYGSFPTYSLHQFTDVNSPSKIQHNGSRNAFCLTFFFSICFCAHSTVLGFIFHTCIMCEYVMQAFVYLCAWDFVVGWLGLFIPKHGKRKTELQSWYIVKQFITVAFDQVTYVS